MVLIHNIRLGIKKSWYKEAWSLFRYVGYRTCIPYHTRMVHTVRVYSYGTTVRVWLFVPYAYTATVVSIAITIANLLGLVY